MWKFFQQYEPQPYDFGYEVKDEHGSQYRKEKSDGQGRVEGSYGFVDENGIYREVYYVADKENGFRAEIKTNEPGTKNEDSADVKIYSEAKNEEEYQGQGYDDSERIVNQGYDGDNRVGNQGYDDSDYRNVETVVVRQHQREHGGHA